MQAIYEARGLDDEIEGHDWAPGGPEGRNITAKGGRVPYLRVIADPHTPCWLCEPGYVCHLCRDQ